MTSKELTLRDSIYFLLRGNLSTNILEIFQSFLLYKYSTGSCSKECLHMPIECSLFHIGLSLLEVNYKSRTFPCNRFVILQMHFWQIQNIWFYFNIHKHCFRVERRMWAELSQNQNACMTLRHKYCL